MPDVAHPAGKAKHEPPIATAGRLCNPAIEQLVQRDAWVCWRYVWRGKWTKPPYTPAGSLASTTAPRTWSSFEECWIAAFVEGRHDGIGRVLVKGEGLVGIDLDNACALDGAVAPWANEIVQSIPSYWERSPSSAGLHGWGWGTWPTPGNKRGPIEAYAGARFFTITGDHFPGTPEHILHGDPGLARLWQQHFVGRQRTATNGAVSTELPEPMSELTLARVFRMHPQIRRIATEREYSSLSERDLALCRIAKELGWPREQAWALVRAVRTDGKAERQNYADHTLARIY